MLNFLKISFQNKNEYIINPYHIKYVKIFKYSEDSWFIEIYFDNELSIVDLYYSEGKVRDKKISEKLITRESFQKLKALGGDVIEYFDEPSKDFLETISTKESIYHIYHSKEYKMKKKNYDVKAFIIESIEDFKSIYGISPNYFYMNEIHLKEFIPTDFVRGLYFYGVEYRGSFKKNRLFLEYKPKEITKEIKQ